MKRLFFIVCTVICLAGSTLGETGDDISARIEVALKAGNASEMAKLLSSSVDLNIPGNEGVYSKAQAQLILKDFFSKHKILFFNCY